MGDVTEQPRTPQLPDGVDDEGYVRVRRLMRLCVLRVWRSDHVIAGMDPWVVVDEAWSSMAEAGFRSEGPFLAFAMRVARNKATDALRRAEARRRDRSLDTPISVTHDPPEHRVLADVTVGSPGADAEYFSRLEHLDAIQRLALAEEAIYRVLSDPERSAFLAVRVAGKSRAAVGRELDPPVTGQRVGQVIAAATFKIRAYIEEREGRAGAI
jgi:DNA-directed RNA polymerase specialized sigma24 family protein